MSKPLVLTCDIGTQSARALLVDPDGRIVDVVQSKYAEPYFSKEPAGPSRSQTSTSTACANAAASCARAATPCCRT